MTSSDTQKLWLSRKDFMNSFDKSESSIYNRIGDLNDILKVKQVGKKKKHHKDNIEVLKYAFKNWVDAALEKYWESDDEKVEKIDPKEYFYWVHMNLFAFESYISGIKQLIEQKDKLIEKLERINLGNEEELERLRDRNENLENVRYEVIQDKGKRYERISFIMLFIVICIVIVFWIILFLVL